MSDIKTMHKAAAGIKVPVIDFGPYLRGEPGALERQPRTRSVRSRQLAERARQVDRARLSRGGGAGTSTGIAGRICAVGTASQIRLPAYSNPRTT
jgi:hypothetical protein